MLPTYNPEADAIMVRRPLLMSIALMPLPEPRHEQEHLPRRMDELPLAHQRNPRLHSGLRHQHAVRLEDFCMSLLLLRSFLHLR